MWKYIANTLETGWFKLKRQSSAYLYWTNGILIKKEYREIGKQSSYDKGDIYIIDRNAYHPNNHTAMCRGSQWISDLF